MKTTELHERGLRKIPSAGWTRAHVRLSPSSERDFLFLVGGFDLLYQDVDLFGLEFVGVLRHASLAVVDDLG